MNQIYLDNNATTMMHPDVAEAIAECCRSPLGNPSSQHELGRRARRRIENAREYVAETLGAATTTSASDHLVFTSGGTESNNMAIFGLAGRPPGNIIISTVEHPSIVAAAEKAAQLGFEIRRLDVDSSGVVMVDQLVRQIDDATRLVSVMLANHETGVLQPVAELAEICASRGVPLHTDAVQAVGKTPVEFRKLGMAALSFSAHKFHGPRGIGGLLIRSGIPIEPILYGGFQQFGLRPGTESVELVVGLEAALTIWRQDTDREPRLRELRDRFEARLLDDDSEIMVHGSAAERLPHTSNLSFPGVDRQALAMALDLAGVACSTGSACASGSSEPSPVLIAMGVDSRLVQNALRFSVSCFTTVDEVDQAARRILRTFHDLRRRIEPGKDAASPRTSIVKPL